jgi:hypothetical protein
MLKLPLRFKRIEKIIELQNKIMKNRYMIEKIVID